MCNVFQADANITFAAQQAAGKASASQAQPYLLKLPAAAALLPHVALHAKHTESSSSAAVHWQRSLPGGTGLRHGTPLNIDLERHGTIALVHEETDPTNASVTESPPCEGKSQCIGAAAENRFAACLEYVLTALRQLRMS